MNKMSGTLADFSLIREDGSRIVIGYGLKEAGDGLYEWYEVYLYKKQTAQVSFEMVKETVIKDIDAKTDAKILNGYPFTPDGAKDPIIVWMSKENQTNFSEAHRLQIVPIKFKLKKSSNLSGD